MKGLAVFFLVAAASSTGGCALDAKTDPQAKHEERVYVTGSNIPRRQQSGEVSVMNQEGYERSRDAVNPSIPMTSGAGH
ncbi:MAG TPA: hypothetical protein VEG27_11260 [Usitatibacter sp.]|nr:hypothetical protein [Usitatibacter sp.]